jgi:hypothetical protein
MRLRPYLTLLRHNPAFTRLFSAQLIGFAGDWFATVALLGLALVTTWALVGLAACAAAGWIAFARPIWRSAAG